MAAARISQRCACRDTGFARASQRYRARRPVRCDTHPQLRARLHTLAVLRPRWGYRRLYRLLRREGMVVHRRRVQRVYREEGLSVLRRHRKRVAVVRVPIAPPRRPNERWFVSLRDSRETIEAWRVDYTDVRPHSGLSDATPTAFALSLPDMTPSLNEPTGLT